MSRYTMTKALGFFVVCLILASVLTLGQQQTIRQTDPQDIRTRQRIDDDLYLQLRLVNWHIQADTAVLDGDNVRDTVYLANKYSDVYFLIFVTQRWDNAVDYFRFATWPLSDSSFVIRHGMAPGDSCSISWMTCHD